MSWRDLGFLISHLSSLATLLREQTALTREQNSLLRELLQAQTGRSARTPRATPPPPLPPHLRQPRTAADTIVMTAADYLAQEIEAQKAARRGPGDPGATAQRAKPTNADPTARPGSVPPNPASR